MVTPVKSYQRVLGIDLRIVGAPLRWRRMSGKHRIVAGQKPTGCSPVSCFFSMIFVCLEEQPLKIIPSDQKKLPIHSPPKPAEMGLTNHLRPSFLGVKVAIFIRDEAPKIAKLRCIRGFAMVYGRYNMIYDIYIYIYTSIKWMGVLKQLITFWGHHSKSGKWWRDKMGSPTRTVVPVGATPKKNSASKINHKSVSTLPRDVWGPGSRWFMVWFVAGWSWWSDDPWNRRHGIRKPYLGLSVNGGYPQSSSILNERWDVP